MKEMFQKIQSLGRQAAQVKEAVTGAPARLDELRQAVALTAGQLQQLKRDVQVNVAGLRAEDGQRVASLLTELVSQAGPIREAGYEIAGVEMEVDPIQRLFLLLDKVDDFPNAQLQSLLAAHATRPSLHGLLSALIKAEELADALILPGLEYRRLRVEVGPVPTIRLCWQAQASSRVTAVSDAPPKLTSTTPAVGSMFGEGSFFERRPSTAPPATPPLPPLQTLPATESTTGVPNPPAHHEAGDSAAEIRSPSALDRFKKMPDLSKRSR